MVSAGNGNYGLFKSVFLILREGFQLLIIFLTELVPMQFIYRTRDKIWDFYEVRILNTMWQNKIWTQKNYMEIWKSISEFVSIWPLLLSSEVQETRILTAGESEELKLFTEFLAKISVTVLKVVAVVVVTFNPKI